MQTSFHRCPELSNIYKIQQVHQPVTLASSRALFSPLNFTVFILQVSFQRIEIAIVVARMTEDLYCSFCDNIGLSASEV